MGMSSALGSEYNHSVKLHIRCREHLTCQTCMLYFVHGIHMGCLLPCMRCVATQVAGWLRIRWNPPAFLRAQCFAYPHRLQYFPFLFLFCYVFRYLENLACASPSLLHFP